MTLQERHGHHDAAGTDVSQLDCGHSHALLLPYPAQGHITPLLQLGQRLASQEGVFVTVAIVEHLHAKLMRAQAAGKGQNMQSGDANLQLVGLKDGLPPEFDRENGTWTDDMKNAIDEALAEGASELVERFAAEGRPVTCVVGDFFLPWTCSVAEKAAVPEFVFWPQCAAVFCIYMHVDAIIAAGYNPFEANVPATSSREDPSEFITCIPGLPLGIHPADLPFEGGPFGQTGVDWMQGWLRDRFGCISKAHGVIGNSFQALESDMMTALSREFQQGRPHPNSWPKSSLRLVGPLVPGPAVGEGDSTLRARGSSLWAEEVQECRQWLDEQAAGSVVFVAFGSVVALSLKQAQELAFGLLGSGQKFLWAIRDKAIIASEEEFRSGSGESSVAAEEARLWGFLEENRQACKVVRWAPQAQVLAHPAVGGFFTHGGWNSTLEALCCGVPLLGWPWLMDQVTNCWLASHVWKVGITLQRDLRNHACRQQVESGVRQLMEGPLAASLRARALEMKALARAAAQENDGILSFTKEIALLAPP